MSGGLGISMHPGEGASHEKWVCQVGTHPLRMGRYVQGVGTHPSPNTWDLGYYGILLTSGRYSSYLNSFLYIFTAHKRSCGKVMFLQLSVSHSVHREGSLSLVRWGRVSGTPPGKPPPPGQTPPPQCMLGYTPPAQCMPGYGQQVSCTRPTRMHSFIKVNWKEYYLMIPEVWSL